MQLPPDKAPLIIVMVDGTLGNFLYVNHLVIDYIPKLLQQPNIWLKIHHFSRKFIKVSSQPKKSFPSSAIGL